MKEIKKLAKIDACIILVGTNSDLENERKVTYQEGKDFATSKGIKFFEVSAKNNINIKEVFETLVEDILNTNPRINEETFKPFLPPVKEKKEGNNIPLMEKKKEEGFGFCNVF